jgi:hypothetical protein
LVVVLLVMMALLGMGLVGLYLTSGSIQMNANINMRNQALFVAEAGINRAKSVLNRTIPGLPNWSPNLSGMLAGLTSPLGVAVKLNVADEVPSDPVSGCQAAGGVDRGAYLRDEPGSVVGCSSNSAYVGCSVTYSNTVGDPNSPPPPPSQTMGAYTLFIRQDLTECRIGNFICDGDPTTPDPNCPTANGMVVIRSEGTASDNRTKVVLEVTMARNPNAPVVNSRLATVCPAGQAGCDDNASVQQGITVSGALTPPPPGAGSTGSTGAGGAGGAGGSAGASSAGGSAAGAGGTTTAPVAGAVGGSTPGGAGAGAGGNAGGAGGASSSSSTVPGCTYDKCNVIAVIGHMGPWDWNTMDCNTKKPTGTIMETWLGKHTSDCTIKKFDIEDPNDPINVDPAAALSKFSIVLLRDIRHTIAERTARITKMCAPYNDWTAAYPGNTPGLFKNSIATALVSWVKAGGGLITTLGYENTAGETGPVNKVLRPLGIAYSELSTEVRLLPWGANYLTTTGGNFLTNPPIASILTSGVYSLQGTGQCGIVGWNGTAEVPLYQSWAPYNRLTSGSYAESGSFSVFLTTKDGGTTPHAVGVAMKVNSGRVIALGDEWITYDADWTPPNPDDGRGCAAANKPAIPGWVNSNNSCTQSFWDNILAWLTATFTP